MIKLLPAALTLAGVFAASSVAAQQMHVDLRTAAVSAGGADAAAPVAPKKPVSLDLSAIDKTADPCNDFYTYACGNWQKQNAIPADQPAWGRFQELDEYNVYSLYQLLEQAANHPTTPLQAKYGSAYESCMNTALKNELGVKPILPVLHEIDGLKTEKELPAFLAKLEDQHGYTGFFGFSSESDPKNASMYIAGLSQGGLSLPDRDYYLQDDERTKAIRAKYVEIMTKMLQLAGDSPEKAAAEAAAVLRVETALAKPSTTKEDLRDPDKNYHPMTLQELQASTPHFDWTTFLNGIHSPVAKLDVGQPQFFVGMDAELASAPVSDLQSYLRWHVIAANGPRLGKAFDDASFELTALFTGQQAQEPQWKRCTRGVDATLGEAVGQDWVAKYYPASARAQMAELIQALEKALGEDLKSLSWMSPATKVEAQKKLAAFRQKIGYPETWRDYSTLLIKRDDSVGNGERSAIFEERRDLKKIGTPVDEREWGMTPPTVNAYYDPSNNDINFPAGILQPPFFDAGLDKPVNYGAIGVVIGHEMTHGFDDQGAKYDDKGNLRVWWTDEDKKKFDTLNECTVKEYGNFQATAATKLNGRLTLGENTADNGGLRIAYAALHSAIDGTPVATEKVDGYTADQRFFLGFAQVWCESRRPQYSELLTKVDPHSPGQFRTNGAVQNFNKFAQAFQCKAGAPLAPAKGCRTW